MTIMQPAPALTALRPPPGTEQAHALCQVYEALTDHRKDLAPIHVQISPAGVTTLAVQGDAPSTAEQRYESVKLLASILGAKPPRETPIGEYVASSDLFTIYTLSRPGGGSR